MRAGAFRLSIFADRIDGACKGVSQFTLVNDKLNATIAELRSRGVVVAGPPIKAPGFMKYGIISDPEGNSIGIAQHLRAPLAPSSSLLVLRDDR